MKELLVFNSNGKNVVDSREVAEWTDRNHKDLLRDIRNYIEILEKSTERKIAPSDFFIPHVYREKITSENAVLPRDYPSALRALADAEEKRMALETELDRSKEWYSIKRVAHLNGGSYRFLTGGGSSLRANGRAMGLKRFSMPIMAKSILTM